MHSEIGPASVTAISAIAQNDVVAIGTSQGPGGSYMFMQQWTGTGWYDINIGGPGEGGGVKLFSLYDGWADGSIVSPYGRDRTLAVHNGYTGWNRVGTPDVPHTNNVLVALAGTSSNDMWAFGGYNQQDGSENTLIEHWKGRVFNIIKSPNVDFHNVLLGAYAAASNDVWVVGLHTDAGANNVGQLILHWNGSAWSLVPPPQTPFTSGSTLSGVSGSSSTDVWAVGTGFDNSGPAATLTEHWDGAKWTFVSSPNYGTQSNQLGGVASLHSNDAVAVGRADNRALIERWDGMMWSVDVTAKSPPNSGLTSITAGPQGELWAAGFAGTSAYSEFHCP